MEELGLREKIEALATEWEHVWEHWRGADGRRAPDLFINHAQDLRLALDNKTPLLRFECAHEACMLSAVAQTEIILGWLAEGESLTLRIIMDRLGLTRSQAHSRLFAALRACEWHYAYRPDGSLFWAALCWTSRLGAKDAP